ncbi:S24/S26 family peptidase [Dysgonomonas sp. Marseille-P4677]|uniref:S24/S26 family peptidase n=1 Tax=Dysgonomonas sp. Marseille-P4677 TaxID=2364790 RepID=UPI001911876D|nr:S24/S26 family peptidase [Dysgonomonas sp. Marseille-P4677]MBK5721504.1 S24/S26 family peptidase [Dysgonomonas sp. Marseille-P4677]
MAVREIPNNMFFTNVKHIIDSGNSVELRIKGTSMYPTLLNGKHKVVLIPYQKQYLQVGSIALFEYENKYILHRLKLVNGNQLVFQGDNLPSVREHVEEGNIVGIVEYIISPDGKITDCKKRRFFIKSKLWLPICQRYLWFIRKMKCFFIKAFAYKNQKGWNKE